MQNDNQYLSTEEWKKLKLLTEYRPKLSKLLGLKEEEIFKIENEEDEYYV